MANRNLHSSREDSATRVWVVLWKAVHAIEQNAVQSVSSLGLGLSDFAVLEVLLHKGPQPVNVIGKKILLTSGSITAAVDRLESKKLVRKTADPEDLRARIVQRVVFARAKPHARIKRLHRQPPAPADLWKSSSALRTSSTRISE